MGLLIVLICGLYPCVVWIIGQTLFTFQANGSIILNDSGEPIGSKLIAQPFTKSEYFHPRPSAANYNASDSASSSLAPSNRLLRERVERLIKIEETKYKEYLNRNSTSFTFIIPSDFITTSGSGLDPHITLQNAHYQLDRVASAWAAHLKRDKEEVWREIESILGKNAHAPLFGLAGEALINVLEVNIELELMYGKMLF